MHAPPFLLDAEHATFLEGGVSITAGARDARRIPTLARALGCRVSADRGRVTLFFSRRQARPLLAALQANGALAVVFNEPRTHRALQIKASDAREVPLEPGTPARVEAYRRAFVQEVGALGFPEPLIRALLSTPEDDLVAVTFTPDSAHLQTPGPQAGAPLGEAP
jgi:hypothetical protein